MSGPDLVSPRFSGVENATLRCNVSCGVIGGLIKDIYLFNRLIRLRARKHMPAMHAAGG